MKQGGAFLSLCFYTELLATDKWNCQWRDSIKVAKKECSDYLLLKICASGDMHIYLLERTNLKILLVKTWKLTENCPGKVIAAAIRF